MAAIGFGTLILGQGQYVEGRLWVFFARVRGANAEKVGIPAVVIV